MNKTNTPKYARRNRVKGFIRMKASKWDIPMQNIGRHPIYEKTSVRTASHCRYLGTCMGKKSVQATSKMWRCLCSTTPFCWEV